MNITLKRELVDWKWQKREHVCGLCEFQIYLKE